jgi:cytidylate kinase
MTASGTTRAQRRYDELLEKGDDVSFDEVLKNVEERDYIDTHRDNSSHKGRGNRQHLTEKNNLISF